MDYRCRLCSLVNWSAVTGSSDPGGTVGPSCSWPSGHIFFEPSELLSISTLNASFSVSVCVFHSCCSRAQVFEKTLLHEFHIYYRKMNGTCSLRSAKPAMRSGSRELLNKSQNE